MADRHAARARPSRSNSLDPKGKRALFEAPVEAPADHLRAGPERAGRDALFSTGKHESGTALVECDSCGARTRLGLPDLGVRLLSFTAWIPGRKYGHWMVCPTCHHRTWCRIGWSE